MQVGGTNRSRRVVGGEGPIAEICGGDGLVRPKKRGNRITKWRDANTGGCVSVSSDQESRGGKGGNPNAIVEPDNVFFFALCCLGKIPGGAPFSQLHKSGNGSRVDRP